MNETGEMEDTTIAVSTLGDNSYQLLPLDVEEVNGPVKKLKLKMRSAGVSSLFCSSLRQELDHPRRQEAN